MSQTNKLTILQENIEIIYGSDLTEDEKKEFDYLEGDEFDCAQFFRHKDDVFWLGNFMRHESKADDADDELKGWHGSWGTSYFHAYVIKLSECGESVTLGQYTV